MNRVTFLYQSNIIQRFFLFHWFELFEHFHEELFTRKKKLQFFSGLANVYATLLKAIRKENFVSLQVRMNLVRKQ